MKYIPKFETKRLIVRLVSLEDFQDYYEFCSDPLVCKYLTFNPYTSSYQAKRSIENMIRAYLAETDLNYSIVLKDTLKVIGSISLSFKGNHIAELGYILNSKYWNKGYMNEVVNNLISIAFVYFDVNVVVAKYLQDNIASEKILIKNGFYKTNIIQNGFIKNGIYYNLVECQRHNNA